MVTDKLMESRGSSKISKHAEALQFSKNISQRYVIQVTDGASLDI